MFEITLYNRNHKGDVTSAVTKSFNHGDQLAEWYDKQRGHSISKEFEAAEKKISVINLNRPTKSQQ